MRSDLQRSLIFLSSLLVLFPSFAQAQVFPSQANPGTLFDPQSDPSYFPTSATQQASPIQEKIEDEGIRVESQPPVLQVSGDNFRVDRVEVEGNTIVSNEEMRRIVSPYEGRELNPEELAVLVGNINEEYRKRGYLTSLAFIPPQDLERGAITIKVLEGMIGDMEVTGNKYFKAKVIEKRISENPGDPLNIPALEKELLRINRQEPYRLKATLLPGERTGETKIRLDVKEQQPFQLALTADNAGRPFIGLYRWGAEFANRNVTGRGDRFDLRYTGSTGSTIASSSYTLPVGSKGTEISGLFGFSHVDVDLRLPNQRELIGNAYNYGLLVSQPLGKERVWTTDLGFNARRVSSFYDGDRISTDDIRSMALGLNYDNYDRFGRSFSRVQATVAPEWLGANSSFFKLENYLTRVTRLPKNNLLILRAYSQWSPDSLPAIEQFQLGGINSVRGYTQGVMIGDKGYNVGAEWRYPIPFLSKINAWMGERIQGALFADYGQVWRDKSSQFFDADTATSLLSAGFGVRAHLTDYAQGFVDVGFGLQNRKDIEPFGNQPTARIHFGVRSELFSNDYKSRTDKVTPIKANVPRVRSVGVIRTSELQSDIADPTLETIDLLHPRVR
ncbi:ShlB/FhaC/HecB family hemolysin secretion/activation protein [Vampirovibrio sp.]|uniref:ShlB/FhaC/HecB family hemolysin secretion/activation protein n=1 Tax=Vampirovibrio sp. TaxID=2717857 RepID=UPI00359402E9